MYLFFDKNGTLKEYINDEALRQGNYGVNKMYVYIADNTVESLDVRYVLPSGLIVGPQNYNTHVTAQIPFDKNRDLRYFKYYTNYDFILIDLEADLNGNSPLDQSGVVHCSISAILDGDNDEQLTLGDVNFNVQLNEAFNQRYVAPQEYMTLSDYQFLRGLSRDSGIYYVPYVDNYGNISWNNNGGKENPPTKNIRGPRGYSISNVVQQTAPQSDGAVNLIYFYSENGANVGSIEVRNGNRGPQGPQGPAGESASNAMYFEIDINGHLIMHYATTIAPTIYLVNDDSDSPYYYETLGVSSDYVGHLIYIY